MFLKTTSSLFYHQPPFINIDNSNFVGEYNLNLSQVLRFSCNNNQITLLPKLDKCQKLFCCNNQLKQLPELPNCRILHCKDNQLFSLPELPSCRWLVCSMNKIQEIPCLPNCINLNASHNQIKIIRNCLVITIINLSHNQIFYIDEIHGDEIDLSYNDLNYVEKLGYVKKINLSFNPLKDYNIIQLRKKYPQVEIKFHREVKNETYKFRYPCDVIFHNYN